VTSKDKMLDLEYGWPPDGFPVDTNTWTLPGVLRRAVGTTVFNAALFAEVVAKAVVSPLATA